MYSPEPFPETRVEEIRRVLTTAPLGTVCFQGPAGLDACHLPFEAEFSADAPIRLLAHAARANPLVEHFAAGGEVLVIFNSLDAYVSPNWYPSKHETHRQVPTWNYQTVHVHGRLQIRDDEGFLRGVMARLTRVHEARVGEAQPWKMGDSDPAYIDALLAEAVGIEVLIERIEAVSKLSQNKDARDRDGVIAAMRRVGEAAMADAIASAAYGTTVKNK